MAADLKLLEVIVAANSILVGKYASPQPCWPRRCINLARGLPASIDPFLMAVVIWAFCPSLTPNGHHSNTLVMAPGGYRLGDCWHRSDKVAVNIG